MENNANKDKEKIWIASFDTNSLIYSIQKKIDILERISEDAAGMEYEVVVPSAIGDEIEKIIASKNATIKEKANCRIALEMLEKWEKEKRIKIEKSEPPSDKWFIKKAKCGKLIVITHDKKLREYLKTLGAKIIMLRR